MAAADPTRLSPETHRALARQAVAFGSRSHLAYLTEALVAARTSTADPLAPLEVLASMQGSAYAARRDQRPALAEVGHWLEAHIGAHLDRGTAPERLGGVLAAELGWLRRLAVHADKKAGRGRGGATHGSTGRGRRGSATHRPTGRFGGRLAALRRRWQRALEQAAEVGPAESTRPEPELRPGADDQRPGADDQRPEPTPAARRYQVGFARVLDARAAWKTARARLKKKKPLKDKRVPLAVRAPALPPGASLEASFARTEGLVEVFRGVDASGGKVVDFHVLAWDDTCTPWLATRVARAAE